MCPARVPDTARGKPRSGYRRFRRSEQRIGPSVVPLLTQQERECRCCWHVKVCRMLGAGASTCNARHGPHGSKPVHPRFVTETNIVAQDLRVNRAAIARYRRAIAAVFSSRRPCRLLCLLLRRPARVRRPNTERPTGLEPPLAGVSQKRFSLPRSAKFRRRRGWGDGFV